MKINPLVVAAVLATAVLCSAGIASAQSPTIDQLTQQINSLATQVITILKQLIAQNSLPNYPISPNVVASPVCNGGYNITVQATDLQDPSNTSISPPRTGATVHASGSDATVTFNGGNYWHADITGVTDKGVLGEGMPYCDNFQYNGYITTVDCHNLRCDGLFTPHISYNWNVGKRYGSCNTNGVPGCNADATCNTGRCLGDACNPLNDCAQFYYDKNGAPHNLYCVDGKCVTTIGHCGTNTLGLPICTADPKVSGIECFGVQACPKKYTIGASVLYPDFFPGTGSISAAGHSADTSHTGYGSFSVVVDAGQSQTFNVNASPGCKISSVFINGLSGSQTINNSSSQSFTVYDQNGNNQTIAANFERDGGGGGPSAPPPPAVSFMPQQAIQLASTRPDKDMALPPLVVSNVDSNVKVSIDGNTIPSTYNSVNSTLALTIPASYLASLWDSKYSGPKTITITDNGQSTTVFINIQAPVVVVNPTPSTDATVESKMSDLYNAINSFYTQNNTFLSVFGDSNAHSIMQDINTVEGADQAVKWAGPGFTACQQPNGTYSNSFIAIAPLSSGYYCISPGNTGTATTHSLSDFMNANACDCSAPLSLTKTNPTLASISAQLNLIMQIIQKLMGR